MMDVDILDYSVYGNQAVDATSDEFLKSALVASGVTARIIPINRGEALSEIGKRVWLRYDLRSLDDLSWIAGLAQRLSGEGHSVFPSERSIRCCEDKWETYLALSEAGVPTIETCDLRATPPDGRRIVVKPRVGWGGMGMEVLERGRAAAGPGQGSHIWQPFIEHRQTWTVLLAGASLIAILEKRAGASDFRTNAQFGEEARLAGDPGGAVALAGAALSAAGLVAGGVDIIAQGEEMKVLEVNSAPCLWYDNLPGLDIAGFMVQSVIEWWNDSA